jgi:plastocyanin
MRAVYPVVLAAPALLAGACGAGAANPAAPAVATVTLRNIAYSPASISVKVGDTVEWVWADGAVPHNIDGASDLGPFDSGSVKTSGTWSFRFTKAGTFTYHCDVHPVMVGTVTVS